MGHVRWHRYLLHSRISNVEDSSEEGYVVRPRDIRQIHSDHLRCTHHNEDPEGRVDPSVSPNNTGSVVPRHFRNHEVADFNSQRDLGFYREEGWYIHVNLGRLFLPELHWANPPADRLRIQNFGNPMDSYIGGLYLVSNQAFQN